MSWQIIFLPEANKDLEELDGAAKRQVIKGLQKVSQNPLPRQQGGYGKSLGNRDGTDLTNLMKIKFRDIGIRIVYKVITERSAMTIIIISARSDERVHKEASKRRKQHGL